VTSRSHRPCAANPKLIIGLVGAHVMMARDAALEASPAIDFQHVARQQHSITVNV
jgi:hypothetical protein